MIFNYILDKQRYVFCLFVYANPCVIPCFCVTGCMLCFGQSAFFRFNHPEEALRMKSMMPEGNAGLSSTYRGHSGRASELYHDYIY